MTQAYLDSVSQKRQARSAEDESTKQREALLGVLQGNQQIAGLLASRKSGNLDVRREKLVNAIAEALENDDAIMVAEHHKELLETLSSLRTTLDETADAYEKRIDDLEKSFTSAVEAISDAQLRVGELQVSALENIEKRLKTPPKPPQVNVTERDVDLSPLMKAIKKLTPKDEGLDLSKFRAQDIDNDSDRLQFVGFVSPEGYWQIIENNVSDDSVRYVFGKGSYENAWGDRHDHEYRVLNEAIDAIRS